MESDSIVTFIMGGMVFEYNEEKNQKNIQKHGISFKNAARVFFDYDRIEFYDKEHSDSEDRYDTIGSISAGNLEFASDGKFNGSKKIIGSADKFTGSMNDILFVVYTERVRIRANGLKTDTTRIISARLATGFERGIYYGKYE